MSSLLAFGLLVYFKRCGYATSDLYVYHTHLAIYLICHPFEIRVHGDPIEVCTSTHQISLIHLRLTPRYTLP